MGIKSTVMIEIKLYKKKFCKTSKLSLYLELDKCGRVGEAEAAH